MTDTPIAEMVPNITPNAWSRDYPDAACPRCPKCSTLLGIRWAQFSESGDDRWACDGCGRTFRSVPFTPTGATPAEVEALRAEVMRASTECADAMAQVVALRARVAELEGALAGMMEIDAQASKIDEPPEADTIRERARAALSPATEG